MGRSKLSVAYWANAPAGHPFGKFRRGVARGIGHRLALGLKANLWAAKSIVRSRPHSPLDYPLESRRYPFESITIDGSRG